MDMINDQDIEHMIPPTPLRDTKPPVGSPISLSPSSSVGSYQTCSGNKLLPWQDNDNTNSNHKENSCSKKMLTTKILELPIFISKVTEGVLFSFVEAVSGGIHFVCLLIEESLHNFWEIGNALCPTMVPNSEKLMEVFIRGLPKSIEGNVTASKPQTLEDHYHKTP
ncbi:hypothetical protein Tco_1050927 [Tanacetum coccineum]